MRALALDIGDSRIGVALSDPLGITAQPLLTIERKKEDCLERLATLVRDHKVGTIVIGIPLMLSGEVGEQAKKVQVLSEQIRTACTSVNEALQIVFWDERLTTVQAERVIQGSKLKDRERRASLDRVSAALILAAFLDSSNRAGWLPVSHCTT